MIKYCVQCKPHAYQDNKYGRNMRVFNPGKKGSTCTVCGGKIGETTEKIKVIEDSKTGKK